ncbi:MAG: DNA alkylation repair protein [Dysgonamonadaceae bacterium]|nr:DNA alkylation repair protein [Dysgonamonadaceae bacterium]MDD3309595.1 DNA alkylation repair protein [Dysgonamonadaceae bacterium]MDD3901484.1 DNA alkylation repair protein [Dysgonamonadaceae bacterium]MDD4398853.1 DNA alkylation repair protein [Dysgonamonadaceae bacterium]MEA5082053.1 DNA alkylation repair protein [Dysgonamonadaceae bacterium]
MNELIKKIRNDLRLSMNGVVSTSMREKGLNYRMNFGVNIPTLKTMAKKYSPDKELAEKLWHEDVRELKILATLLYPVSEFTEENAQQWVNEIPNQEIREQVCMNLFQKLDFADGLVEKWTGSDNDEVRTTGYWLFVRLMMIQKSRLENEKVEGIVDRAVTDVQNASFFLKKAALETLKRVGRNNMLLADKILERVKEYSDSDDLEKKEVYDSLSFEFELFRNK